MTATVDPLRAYISRVPQDPATWSGHVSDSRIPTDEVDPFCMCPDGMPCWCVADSTDPIDWSD